MKLYNTLTRALEKVEPLTPPKLTLYVCGPTVYDHAHIGHARAYVVYDVLVRSLKALGHEVVYARNITDIDDKIIQRAQAEGVPYDVIAERYTASFHSDLARLGLLPPDVEPRATETIREIVAMIQSLIDKGHAYVQDHDVYFSVRSYDDYGDLSNRKLDDLLSGARVAKDDRKKDPLDFALWKEAKPKEPFWPSPWGKGRPGWHIECSAMIEKHLGTTIDLHGGGLDLVFPHHTNEIAQSTCHSEQPFVRHWLHNGLVTLKDEKMSKSLGNVVSLKDLLKTAHEDAVKLLFLKNHYRSPIEYSSESLEEAGRALDRLNRFRMDAQEHLSMQGLGLPKTDGASDKELKVLEYLRDDLNTPKALAVLFDLVREGNQALVAGDSTLLAEKLRLLNVNAGVLGLLTGDAEAYFKRASMADPSGADEGEGMSEAEVESWIEKRNAARASKDFQESDRIRDMLKDQGILLEDAKGRTVWKRSRS